MANSRLHYSLSSRTSSSTEDEVGNAKTKTKDIYGKLDANKLVDAYGVFGRYQLFGYILCQSLNFTYAASMYVMSYVQLSPILSCTDANGTSLDVDMQCQLTNKDSSKGQCGLVEDTYLNISDSVPITSMIKEYDLTCGHVFWKEASIVVFTVAALVTVPFTSALADRYGRRPILLASYTISFIASIAASFAPSFWMFLALRFIIGASSDTFLSISSILTCEYLSSNCRAWVSLVYTVMWSCGMFWVGLLSLVVTEWRWMYLIHSAPGVVFLLYFFLLPESPHWLIHMKKRQKIKEYIRISNKWNKTTIDLETCLNDNNKNEVMKQSIKHICASRTMWKYLIINGFIQFCLSLYYFAISFMSVDLSDDKFTTFMLSAFVEIPGGLVVIPLMTYLSRRFVVFGSMLVQGLLLAAAPFAKLYGLEWLSTGLLLTGKLVNSITYGIHPVYSSEMMPTSVRSLAYSIINVPQSLGIILSPYFKHLINVGGADWIRFVFVGVLCIIGGALVYLLPETKDKAMPPDIESLPGKSLTISDSSTNNNKEEQEKLLNNDGSSNSSSQQSLL